MNSKEFARVLAFAILITIIVMLVMDLRKSKKEAADNAHERDLERERNRLLANRNEYLRNQIFVMYNDIRNLRASIENGESIDHTVIAKLDELIAVYEPINGRVSIELLSVKKLIEVDEPSKATFALVKVIENQLKERCEADPAFAIPSGRFVTFNDYLNHALHQGYIDKEEFNFAKGLKDLRNQEAHEVDVQKEKGLMQCAMLLGVGMILKLSIV
jgi:hypothetical protein